MRGVRRTSEQPAASGRLSRLSVAARTSRNLDQGIAGGASTTTEQARTVLERTHRFTQGARSVAGSSTTAITNERDANDTASDAGAQQMVGLANRLAQEGSDGVGRALKSTGQSARNAARDIAHAAGRRQRTRLSRAPSSHLTRGRAATRSQSTFRRPPRTAARGAAGANHAREAAGRATDIAVRAARAAATAIARAVATFIATISAKSTLTIVISIVGIGGLIAMLMAALGATAVNACTPQSGAGGVVVDPATVPAGPIAGFEGTQLVNAATIIKAGADRGLTVRDQTLAVMVAIGESTLNNIDYGDWETSGVTNPNGSPTTSIGLFQQQDNWGSVADRMDPYQAATLFYNAMVANVPERDTLEPTIVGHKTQGNLDPSYYAQFWGSAVEIVEGLSGVTTGLSAGGTGSASSCAGGLVPGQVSLTGWAAPAAGPLTDGFGARSAPCDGCSSNHRGVDFVAGGCSGPIWAAQAGTVTFAGFDSADNGTILIDHGGGVETKYLHMEADGILVATGTTVAAGQQIGKTGNSGQSTGCHLHFEVLVDGTQVDPQLFMTEVGITLG